MPGGEAEFLGGSSGGYGLRGRNQPIRSPSRPITYLVGRELGQEQDRGWPPRRLTLPKRLKARATGGFGENSRASTAPRFYNLAMLPWSIVLLSLWLPGCPALDTDGDGVIDSEDCGPLDPEIHPGATELCDGVDSDCDGLAADAEDDPDGDHSWACGADCAPEDGTRGPAAAESCNGIDDDCDGTLRGDEGDLDGDGVAPCAGDCAPGDPARSEGLPELCDGLDNDCDYQVPPDEVDGDGDGVRLCLDCDDGDAARFPGNSDICNRRKDDCDGDVDEDADWDGSHAVPLVGELSSADAWATFVMRQDTPDASYGFGKYVLGPGDVNGDGFADVVISTTEGAWSYLFYGPFCHGEYDSTAADAVLEGPPIDYLNPGAKLGWVGDLNLDGYAEVRVGSFVYFGPLTGLRAWETADITVWSGEDRDSAGPGLSPGDMNGDGWPDLVWADPYSPPTWYEQDQAWGYGPGQVVVFYGPFGSTLDMGVPDGLITGEPLEGGFGGALASGGDLDGDGLADLLIGKTTEWGAVFVALSPILGDTAAEDLYARFNGPYLQGGMGSALAAIGDNDGDGFGDFLFGAPGTGYSEDRAWLVPGPLAPGVHAVEHVGREIGVPQGDPAGTSGLGTSICAAGDLDGDGLDDFVVRATSAWNPYGGPGSAGATFVGLSPTASTDLDQLGAYLFAQEDWGIVGWDPPVAAAGDTNGDGRPDLLLGWPGAGPGVSYSAASLFLGGPSP